MQCHVPAPGWKWMPMLGLGSEGGEGKLIGGF
jgi:hypothetical protein